MTESDMIQGPNDDKAKTLEFMGDGGPSFKDHLPSSLILKEYPTDPKEIDDVDFSDMSSHKINALSPRLREEKWKSSHERRRWIALMVCRGVALAAGVCAFICLLEW